MKIVDLNDLRDSRIMMDREPPRIGFFLLWIITLILAVLIAWSTKAPRLYIVQASGMVQSSNKTYIMSTTSGAITRLNISEGSYVNEGDLVAVLQSTDLALQREQLQAQLALYEGQLAQYNKLLKSIRDNKNYFSETSAEDQPYYFQYETYQNQVQQYSFDSSAYAGSGYTDAQILSLIEQNQRQVQNLYYSTMQSISGNITSIQTNIAAYQAQMSALESGAESYNLYAPTSGIIHMDNPYTEGMVLSAGSPLATLSGANSGGCEAVAYVSMNDRPLIHEGDRCTVNVVGLATSAYGSLSGHVTSIDSDYTSTGGATAYKLNVALDNDYLVSTGGDKVNLTSGMAITASIVYDEVTYFQYVMELLGMLVR